MLLKMFFHSSLLRVKIPNALISDKFVLGVKRDGGQGRKEVDNVRRGNHILYHY